MEKDLKQKLQDALVPAQLAEEFQLYQQSLGQATELFFNQLPEIIETLKAIDSPFMPKPAN